MGVPMDTARYYVLHREFRALPAIAAEEKTLNLMRREAVFSSRHLMRPPVWCASFSLEASSKPKEWPNPVVILARGKGRTLEAPDERMLQANGVGGWQADPGDYPRAVSNVRVPGLLLLGQLPQVENLASL